MDEAAHRAPATRDELTRALEAIHPACYGWALACCGRKPHEAGDVLQASYLKVLDGRARFAGRSTFRTWVFGVIRRTAAEERRQQLLRRLRLVRLTDADELPASGDGADVQLVRTEQQEQLVGALERLARRQREVLDLVFYHEMSVSEAAQVMGVSVGSARRHYDRGKQRLRALLGDLAP